ncbi:hypothetical protein EMCRGX_G002343 [Ephydatia muelleri]
MPGDLRLPTICDILTPGDLRLPTICDILMPGDLRLPKVCDILMAGDLRLPTVCDILMAGDQRLPTELIDRGYNCPAPVPSDNPKDCIEHFLPFILSKTNPWDKDRLDEPDYTARLVGYAEVRQLRRAGQWEVVHLVPILYNTIFFRLMYEGGESQEEGLCALAMNLHVFVFSLHSLLKGVSPVLKGKGS